MRGTFKNLGALLVAAFGAGLDLQFRRAMHRAVTVKRGSRGLPHRQGPRETERRRRQMARGQLEFHSYER